MNLLLYTFEYPPRNSSAPNYIDPFNQSSSISVGGSWILQAGHRKYWKIKKTAENATGWAGFGISDESFNMTYYNQSIAENFSVQDELIRNVSGYFIYQDGNFTNNVAYQFEGKGLFCSKTGRGVMDAVFVSFLETPEKKFNDTEMIPFLENTSFQTTWPPIENISDFEEGALDRTDNNKFKKKNCEIRIYFNIRDTERVIDKRYKYSPDNEIRKQWRLEGRPNPNNESTVLVPSFDAIVYSSNCALNMTASGRLGNGAVGEREGQMFFAGLGLISIIYACVCLKFVVSFTSQARQQTMSMTALCFHMNAESLTTYLIFFASAQVYLVTLSSFILIIQCLAFIPLLVRTIMLMYVRFIGERQLSFCAVYIRLVGYSLSAILPGMVLMIITIYIPFWIVFALSVIATSYLLVYSLQQIFKPSGFMCFPLWFVIANLLHKVGLMIYIFGFNGFFGFEYSLLWVWILIGIQAFQLLFYIIQYFTNGRCGAKLATTITFDYGGQLLTPSIIHTMAGQIGLDEFSVKEDTEKHICYVVFQKPLDDNQKDSEICQDFCANPSHHHSVNFQENLDINSFLKIQKIHYLYEFIPTSAYPKGDLEQHTNCYCFCSKKVITDTLSCNICLDELNLFRLTNSAQLYHIFIKSSQTKQIFEYETHSIEQKLESTPGLPTYTTGDMKEPPLGADDDSIEIKTLYITPCQHCFHKTCLERWLEENLQCPVCRETISLPE